ncbi:hypothetical protein [Polymorphum gilvum]|uniref:Uncharacterized protein n=1 Tax=Polymorphum gilvum (strain LMG 25793 / CGMCC 1.9160 / SL003B-26A1) TaxID=991905 RepID=F2IZR8_POLGS|nr:hypothetical protein [Polymorphum gilvum]ADZ70644.1 hypothetical protein SL003B_2219 [Polymorphum gilvum SL003B-26A1]
MTTFETIGLGAARTDGQSRSEFNRLVWISAAFAAAILAVIASAALAFPPSASAGDAAAKANRLDGALPASCSGQAWGAWSPDCLAALTGNTSLRPVGTVTVEQRPAGENVSVLMRLPANG